MSISAKDNNIKIWNINNLEFLINIKNINKKGYLNSACFLKDNNEIYIVTSNFYYCTFESIKIFDLKGNKIIEIKESNDKTYFIDTFYDKNLCKNFIIASNIGYIKSYDYNENKIYHKYIEIKSDITIINVGHPAIIINGKNKIVKLIESCWDGYIRVWNFHTGKLLKKIYIINKRLGGICLFDKKYLFVGGDDNSIKLIDLKKELVIKELKCTYDYYTLKKLYCPKYGECLLSLGFAGNIKLWTN